MINLLPPEQKRELKTEEKWKLSLILEIILLIFLICLFLILLSIRISIASELEVQRNFLAIEEQRYKTPEIKEFQEKITLINKNLSEIKFFYQEQPDLTGILEKISATLPPRVYLTHIAWQEETSRVNLSGFAPLREDLLALKKNLENEKGFELSANSFPASDWLKSKNIDFYAAFKVKPLK